MSENLAFFFFPYSIFNIFFFFKSLKERHINQIDIFNILFMPCPVSQEIKPLHFLRKLKDFFCLIQKRHGFSCSCLLGLEGGMGIVWLLDCSWQSRKTSLSLHFKILQAVCELQWNFEQVKQHIICDADVLITRFSVVMDFLSSNYETEMTTISFYWWWHLSCAWCSQNEKKSLSLRTDMQIRIYSVFKGCT